MKKEEVVRKMDESRERFMNMLELGDADEFFREIIIKSYNGGYIDSLFDRLEEQQ